MADGLGVAACAQRGAIGLAATVLPDDGVVDRLARAPVPHDGGLALVRDPQCRDVAPGQARLRKRLTRRIELRLPDLPGVVLDPAGLRVDLAKLALRHRDDAPERIEDDAARARGPLVQGKEVGHARRSGVRSAVRSIVARNPAQGPTLPAMLRDHLFGPRARRRWLVVFVLLCAVTLAVALLPATRAPNGTGWDKLDHLLAFAALGVVGVLALRPTLRGAMLVLAVLVMLGAGIEWLQSLVPSRRPDFADFVADMAGAVAGTLLAWLLARKAGLQAAGTDPAQPD